MGCFFKHMEPAGLKTGRLALYHELVARTWGRWAVHSETFLDHFQNPRNAGELGAPAVTVEVSNPACGDILRLSARFEGETVAEARFKVRGCTASIAAASALTEWMTGRPRAELRGLRVETVEEAVGGLIPESRHAAVLCVDGVKKLLAATATAGA